MGDRMGIQFLSVTRNPTLGATLVEDRLTVRTTNRRLVGRPVGTTLNAGTHRSVVAAEFFVPRCPGRPIGGGVQQRPS